MNTHDARMTQLCSGASFTQELFGLFRQQLALARNLDRNSPIERLVVGTIDVAKRTNADFVHQIEMADGFILRWLVGPRVFAADQTEVTATC